MPKKSQYKIVPMMHEKFGQCWALKEGNVTIGTFIEKSFAEDRKIRLEKQKLEDFLLMSTANQKLKIEEDDK